jgi:hypothetical protein
MGGGEGAGLGHRAKSQPTGCRDQAATNVSHDDRKITCNICIGCLDPNERHELEQFAGLGWGLVEPNAQVARCVKASHWLSPRKRCGEEWATTDPLDSIKTLWNPVKWGNLSCGEEGSLRRPGNAIEVSNQRLSTHWNWESFGTGKQGISGREFMVIRRSNRLLGQSPANFIVVDSQGSLLGSKRSDA